MFLSLNEISMVTLETSRLRLQPFTLEDLEYLLDLHSDPKVNQYLTTQGVWSKELAKQKLDGFIHEQRTLGYSKFKVTLKDGTFIGRAGFSLWEETGETELGYSLKAEFWGKGYATEAAQKLIDWIFETTNLSHIIAFSFSENTSSQKVLEKLGMSFVENRLVDGFYLAFYRMTRG
jgi:[ribosomal protein S5]-alanine N-acetyltransferase